MLCVFVAYLLIAHHTEIFSMWDMSLTEHGCNMHSSKADHKENTDVMWGDITHGDRAGALQGI